MSAKQQSQITSRRDKIARANSTVFVAVAIASVVVVMSIISIRFLWNQKSYNDSVISSKTEVRDQINTNLSNLDELKNEFPALKDRSTNNSETILHALPPVYDYAGLASSISFLARESGVRFSGGIGEDASAAAIRSAPTSAPVEIPLSLSVEGDYTTIRRFIRNLELSIRPFTVTAVDYSGTSSSLTAGITATTYYQPARSLDVEKEAIQ